MKGYCNLKLKSISDILNINMATPNVSGYYRVGNDVYDPQGNYISFAKAQQMGIVPLLEGIPQKTVGETPAAFDPASYGITPDLWAQLDPGTQAFVESAAKVVQGQYNQGAINVSVNADLLNKAMAAAATDPDIKAKYGDSFAMAQADLSNNLAYINADYAQSMGITLAQQEQAKKTLSEQEAEAGRAYSGFREQAKGLLEKEQSGVIESAKRQLQQQVQKAGSAYESAFGTSALQGYGTIGAGGQTYAPVGGITGTEPLAEKQDIYSKGQSIFAAERLQ